MQNKNFIMFCSRIFALSKPKLSFMILGVFMGIISSSIYPICSMLCQHIMRENGSNQEVRNLKYIFLLISLEYLKILKIKIISIQYQNIIH